jgi:hypothetical protein
MMQRGSPSGDELACRAETNDRATARPPGRAGNSDNTSADVVLASGLPMRESRDRLHRFRARRRHPGLRGIPSEYRSEPPAYFAKAISGMVPPSAVQIPL